MQFRFLPALLVFLGSYFPLALILLFQDISWSSWESATCTSWKSCHFPIFRNPWLAFSVLGVTALCLCLTFLILRKIRYKYPIEIIEVKPIPNELINYSFPYIVSFMGVDYLSLDKISGLVIFLVWLFLITLKSGQIIMNPVLLIFGWNLYEAKVFVNGSERTTNILSKTYLIPGKYHCDAIQNNYITRGNIK